MDLQIPHNNNWILLIVSLIMGITGLIQIKPILDFIFISLGIIGLIISIAINIRKLLNNKE